MRSGVEHKLNLNKNHGQGVPYVKIIDICNTVAMRRLANGFYNFHKAYKGVDKLYKNCNIHMKNY
jgi:hypothetical protein